MNDKNWVNVCLMLSGIAVIATTIALTEMQNIRHKLRVEINEQLSQPAWNLHKANDNLNGTINLLINSSALLKESRQRFEDHVQEFHGISNCNNTTPIRGLTDGLLTD